MVSMFSRVKSTSLQSLQRLYYILTSRKSKLYLPDARLPEVPTYHPIVLPDGKLCKLQKVTDDELWGLIQDRFDEIIIKC